MTRLGTSPERAQSPDRWRRRARSSGMTLVEILIVLIIVTICATGVSFGFGAIFRTQLRAAANRIVSASRYAYNRAITENKTVRIVLDASQGTLSLEEASGRITLAHADDERRQNNEAGEEQDAAAVDPWEAAAARLSETFRPTLGRTGFGLVPGSRFAPAPLGDGIRILRMVLPHEPEPRTEGRGSIYYFPGGITERAVVYLVDSGDTVYTVVIQPLTGRGQVYNEEHLVEPVHDDADDEDRSEVRDPG